MDASDLAVSAEDANVIIEYIQIYGLKVLAALVIFLVGKWAARRIANVVEKMMRRASVDETLVVFGGNIINIAILAFVVIAAISKLGVETTSVAAVFAAAGLAIGLALQGSLSNFAAGVLIVLFKPFKLGDFVDAAGESGTVSDISIFTTTLKTPDNKTIIIPNGSISNGSITNYSAEANRRVDMVFGIGYDDDIKKAKSILEKLIKADKRVLKDPEYKIALSELGDSSVDFVVRPWVKREDYWQFKWDFTEAVKTTFDKEGISIPFPQRDVHIHQADAASSNDNKKPAAAKKTTAKKKAS